MTLSKKTNFYLLFLKKSNFYYLMEKRIQQFKRIRFNS